MSNCTQLEKNLWVLGFPTTLFSAKFPAQLAKAELMHERRMERLDEMRQDPVWAAKIADLEAMAPSRWLPYEALVHTYNGRVRLFCASGSDGLSLRRKDYDAMQRLAKGLRIGAVTIQRLRDAGIDVDQFIAEHSRPKP